MNPQSTKFKLRKHGFTLIEALVGMVMVAGGMLAMVTVSDIQSDSNKRARFNSEVERFITDVDVLMRNGAACRQTVMNPGGAVNLAQLQNNVQTINDEAGNTFVNAGDIYDAANGGIARIRGINAVPAPGYAWVNPGIFAFNLEFTIEPSVDLGNTISQFRKTLPAPIYVSIAGGIDDCVTGLDRMLEEVRKETCESMGGTFTPATVNDNVFCTFAGENRGLDPETGNPIPDVALPIPAADSRVLARDFAEETAGNVFYSQYLKNNAAGADQTINGAVAFSGLSGSNGVIITNVGSYPPSNSATSTSDGNIIDFENRVPNFNWINDPANFSELLRHGAAAGNYCDENNTNSIVVLSNAGPICVDAVTLQCPGGTTYLQGFNPDGTAICTPLISGNTSCPDGQSYQLVESAGSLSLQCVACSDSSEWVDTGAPTCSCLGAQEQMQYCVSRCGQPCPGGGSHGDIRRQNTGTCIAPPACGGGTGGACVVGAVCSSDPDCNGGTCSGGPSSCTGTPSTNPGFCGANATPITYGSSSALPRLVTPTCATGAGSQTTCEGLMEQGSTATTYYHCQWAPATCGSMGFDAASCNAVAGCSWTVSGGSCSCPSSSSSSGPTPSSSGGSCSGYSDFDMCGSTCLGKPLLLPVPTTCCSGEPDYPGPNAPCE